jgi:hypothetical protein
MIDARRVSWPWLAAAGAVFVADIFLHLPITDICDDLVKRFGFFTFDGVVRRGFVAFGFVFLCGAWIAPRRERAVVGAATVALMAVAVAAQLLIVLNAVEDVHYPQYALLSFLLARGLPTTEGAWIGATALGIVDEGYQFVALPRGRPTYFDWNDVVLNGIGAAFGALIVVRLLKATTEPTIISRKHMLTVAAAAIVVAVILAPPIMSPFFEVTPGGRHFHRMGGSEAIVVVSLLWWGVRYLVGRASAAGPTRPAA